MTALGRLAALGASSIAFGGTALVLLLVPVSGWLALTLAASVSAVLAGVLAFHWPNRGWRWGLWSSSAFSAYFLIVALAYLASGRPEWHPVLAAGMTAIASCGAAFVSSRNREPGWTREGAP